MPEDNGRTIRIPVSDRVEGHEIRTIVISRDKGIKALYDVNAKKVVTYVFEKSKGWTMAKAKEWISSHKTVKKCEEVHIDQEKDFIRLVVTYEDDVVKSYEPSYGESFVMTQKMIDEEDEMAKGDSEKDVVYCSNCDYSGDGKVGDKCPKCGSKLTSKPKKEKGCGDSDGRRRRKKAYYAKCHTCSHEEEMDELPKSRSKCSKCDKDMVFKSVVIDGGDDRIVVFSGEKEEDVVLKGMPQSYRQGNPDVRCGTCNQSEVGYCIKYDTSISNEYVCDNYEARGEEGVSQVLDIVKTDKTKQVVYGVFLWPDKADHDGDIISAEDIEKVAHDFLVEYRDIDEMHEKQTLDAEIVESFIAWDDNIQYYGKTLKKGAWAGAIHVSDEKVWEKIEKGEYRGFSVRISGTREPASSTLLEGNNG
jgi:hypothetical protein